MAALAPISRIAVIGAGQMGLGIAFVAAVHAKLPLTIHDPSPSVLSSAMKKFEGLLSRDVEKNRMTSEFKENVLSRVRGVQSDGTAGMDEVDLVIEAIPEIPALKTNLFISLAAQLPSPVTLASNTSSISITRLAAAAAKKSGKESAARVVGKLCEIIPALQTSTFTLSRARSFGEACGKVVTQSKDSPGFIANAILMPMINEAVMVLEKGVATAEDIDTTFKLGMGHPMGPLALADLIGLDTCLAVQRVLFEESGDSKYRPAGLLSRMVDAGWVGKKAGKGFYEYPSQRS
ncbi:hypothetical protein P7C73_g1418, partial [Tremellales sp. Uapishka_1]